MKTMGSFLETASEKETVRIETAPSKTVTADFAYGFIYIDEPVYGRADLNDDGDFLDTDEKFYYTSNNLYCVATLLDTSGDIIEAYEYTPYGSVTIYTGDGGDGDWFDGDETTGSLTGNYYTFQGRRFDLESGLMYYRERYYSPPLGRFISRDPVIALLRSEMYRSNLKSNILSALIVQALSGSDSMNLYSANQLIRLLDPFGLLTQADCDAIITELNRQRRTIETLRQIARGETTWEDANLTTLGVAGVGPVGEGTERPEVIQEAISAVESVGVEEGVQALQLLLGMAAEEFAGVEGMFDRVRAAVEIARSQHFMQELRDRYLAGCPPECPDDTASGPTVTVTFE